MTLLYVHKLTVLDATGRERLSQVSFDIEPGQILGLAGGPGAGKSLLCQLLTGRVPDGFRVSGGRILFGDRDLTAGLEGKDAIAARQPAIRLYDADATEITGDPPRDCGGLVTAQDPMTLVDCCDEIAVLCVGRLVERAPAQELVRAPQHPYTQSLLADPGRTNRATPTSGGCPFGHDCSFAESACGDTAPTLQSVSAHHATACIRWRALSPLAA